MTNDQAPSTNDREPKLFDVHPWPWRVVPVRAGYGQCEVLDADGDCLISFDGNDDGWFWRGIVQAINDQPETRNQ